MLASCMSKNVSGSMAAIGRVSFRKRYIYIVEFAGQSRPDSMCEACRPLGGEE